MIAQHRPLGSPDRLSFNRKIMPMSGHRPGNGHSEAQNATFTGEGSMDERKERERRSDVQTIEQLVERVSKILVNRFPKDDLTILPAMLMLLKREDQQIDIVWALALLIEMALAEVQRPRKPTGPEAVWIFGDEPRQETGNALIEHLTQPARKYIEARYPQPKVETAQQANDRKLDAFIELLEAVTGLLPPWLHDDVLGELYAIRSGGALTILEPRKTHRQGDAHGLDVLRLKALHHIAFRHGHGGNKENARGTVADAFEIVPETSRKWEKRMANLRPGLKASLERTQQLGEYMKELEARKAAEQTSPSEWTLPPRRQIRALERRYGDSVLKRDGAAYAKLKRPGPERQEL
jgi:hypothetical protein